MPVLHKLTLHNRAGWWVDLLTEMVDWSVVNWHHQWGVHWRKRILSSAIMSYCSVLIFSWYITDYFGCIPLIFGSVLTSHLKKRQEIHLRNKERLFEFDLIMLNGALTLTSPHIFGINGKANCEPRLRLTPENELSARSQCALLAGWGEFCDASFQSF